MPLKQPVGPTPGSNNPTDHLLAAVAVMLLALGGLAIVSPLLLPLAIILSVRWHRYGGSERLMLGLGLAATALIVLIGDGPAAMIAAGWDRWALLGHVTDPGETILVRVWRAVWFVTGFGLVQVTGAMVLAGAWCWRWSIRSNGHPRHPREREREETRANRARRKGSRQARTLNHIGGAWLVYVDGKIPAGFTKRTRLARGRWRPRRRAEGQTWPEWWQSKPFADCWLPSLALVLSPTPARLGKSMVILGAPGSGKTVAVERLGSCYAWHGMKTFVADLKGTNASLGAHFTRIFRAFYRPGGRPLAAGSRPVVRELLWPGHPINGWSCNDPEELVGRLLVAARFFDEGPSGYWRDKSKNLLQCAISAPGEDGVTPCPPTGSDDFLRRLDKTWMGRAWRLNTPKHLKMRERIKRMEQVSIDNTAERFDQYLHGLNGKFDGPLTFDQYDCGVLAVQGLGDREHAKAIAAHLLGEFEHFGGCRKHDLATVALIIDELSAVPTVAPQVVNQAERAREAGIATIFTAQSLAGIGDDRLVEQMLGGVAGGVLLMKGQDGERLRRLGGQRVEADLAWKLNAGEAVDDATLRERAVYDIDPDLIGRAMTGEAWLLSDRSVLHAFVIASEPSGAEGPEHAEAAGHVADMAEELAAANVDDGLLWAYLRRVADEAGELAPAPEGTPELPRPGEPQRIMADSWRVPPPKTVVAFCRMVLARVRDRVRVRR